MKMENSNLRSVFQFFFLVFVISWALFVPAAIMVNRGIIPLSAAYIPIGIGTFVPSILGLILRRRQEGKAGFRRYIKRAFNFRLGWGYLPLFAIVPTAFLASHGMNVLRGVPFPSMEASPLKILLIFIAQLLLTGSLGEEFGWSGYALPKLLKQYHWLPCGAVVGALWGLWHLPGFRVEGTSQFYLPFIPFVLSTMASSMLIGWMQKRFGFSIIPAFTMHAFVNTIFELAPLVELKEGGDAAPWHFFNIIIYLVIAVIFIVEKMRQARLSGAAEKQLSESM